MILLFVKLKTTKIIKIKTLGVYVNVIHLYKKAPSEWGTCDSGMVAFGGRSLWLLRLGWDHSIDVWQNKPYFYWPEWNSSCHANDFKKLYHSMFCSSLPTINLGNNKLYSQMNPLVNARLSIYTGKGEFSV